MPDQYISPCPFCESSEVEVIFHLEPEFYIWCAGCEATGPVKPTTSAAIAAWNGVLETRNPEEET